MLKEVLDKKKALLEAIEEEERASKTLIQCVKSIKEKFESDDGKAIMGASQENVKALNDVLKKVLDKRSGAASYSPQLFIQCQNAMDVLNTKKSIDQEQKKKKEQEIASAKDTTSKKDEVEREPPSNIPTLKANVLGLLNMDQLVRFLEKHSENPANLMLILDRFKMIKVTATMLKNTGAGKAVAKLKKHSLRALSEKANAVVNKWMQDVAAAKKEEKKREEKKKLAARQSNDRDKPRSRSATPPISAKTVNKNRKDTPHPGGSKDRGSRERGRDDRGRDRDRDRERDRGRDRERERAQRERERDRRDRDRRDRDRRDRDREPKRKKLSREDSEEAWFRERRAQLRSQHERVQMEEEYSAVVGEREDQEAELDEKRAKRKKNSSEYAEY